MRILVVEDEPNLNGVIVKKLKTQNYAVDSCLDGIAAEEHLAAADYDVVVLDIMLPRKNGLTVLADMRSKGDKTPVLLLTAKDGIEDRIKGLDAGADDYLVKPFAFGEMMARLRALTRRPVGHINNVYEFAGLVVDTDARTTTRDGKSIPLSSKEFAVLENLIRNKGIVLSRERIEQNAWDFSYEGGSNVVDVYIRYLRKKIDDDFPVKLIHTVRGSGYVLKVEE
jgi:two-component system, OmpR family, copper resistance phosphate regulon response regulator CusR